MLKKNDVIKVTLEDINHLGMGVAKHEGIVIFVRGGVTGDVLNVKIIKVAKDYLVAIISEIIEPSAYRAEPTCPSFKRCGGCVYSHISFEYENILKRQRVENEFRRFGINDINVLPTVYANESAYRNKLQCPVAESGEMGFYAQKSHDIIPLSSCSLQEELTAPIFEFLSGYFKSHPIPSVKHVYLRCGKNTGEIMVCFVCKNKSFKEETSLAGEIIRRFENVKSIILNHNPKDTNVILGDKCRVIWGTDSITDVLCGLKFVINPLAFYQVNHDCTELLYSAAAKAANIQPCETVCDLFCGIGTVGLCINAMTPAKKLIGVEIIPEAIENAKQNAALNGIDNAEFYCSAAEDFQFERPDVLIVDPPRKGLAPKLVDYIGSLLPDRIVYISCSPDTLARDCEMLMKYGYTFKDVQPVNMFPRTAHVESVVCLSRETTHEMKLHASPFEMIKSGEKTIELRLFDEKRQKIKEGDVIVFTNTLSGEKLSAAVTKLHRFDSFEELYKTLPLLQCGYTAEDVDTAHPSDMEQYYSEEEQKNYGVVGIELFPPKRITDESVVCLMRN